MVRKNKYSAVIDETVAKCRTQKKVTRLMIKRMLKESMRQRGFFNEEDFKNEALMGSLVSKVMILLEND